MKAAAGSDPRWKERLFLAAALSLPFVLAVCWFNRYLDYPTSDAGHYMYPGLGAYNTWKTEGFRAALHDLYWHRIWKPIFHPVLAFPALLATGGDARLSVALVNLSVLGIFLLFLAKFARLFLPRGRSLAVTWFVGTLPWVQASSFYFMNELPFLAASMAVLLLMFTEGVMRSEGGSFRLGVSLAFVFLFQPFVALVSLGAGFLLRLREAVASRDIRARDLAMAVPPLGLAGLLCLAYQHGRPESGRPIFLGLAFLAVWMVLWWGLLSRGRFSRPFFILFASATLPLLAWYLPFLHSLVFNWAYNCTFSASAQMVGQKAGTPVLFYVKQLSAHYGGVFPVAAAVLGMVGWIADRFFASPRGPSLRPGQITVLIALPLLMGFLVYNNDTRYYAFSFTVLCLVSAISAARPRPTWRVLPFWGFLPAALAGAGMAALVVVKPTLLNANRVIGSVTNRTYRSYFWKLNPAGSSKPMQALIARMGRMINLHEEKSMALVVHGIRGMVFDIFVMGVLFLERGYAVDLNVLDRYPCPPSEVLLDEIRRNNDYVLLSLDLGDVNSRLFPAWRFNQDFLRWWKNGRLARMGFRSLGEIAVQDARFVLLDTGR